MGRVGRQGLQVALSVLTGLMLLLGCGGGGSSGALLLGTGAIPGPWVIPAAVLAAGDAQYVENTQAGAWSGAPCSPCAQAAGCAGGIRPGTYELAGQLGARFPQITAMAGYCCRDICSTPPSGLMTVHGTGRALDLAIPLAGGDADNVLGDEIGNWLIEHAQEVGIQLIIWDYWMWDASREAGAKSLLYFRDHPHTDHLHVELSVDGAERRTPWFTGALAAGQAAVGRDAPEAGRAPAGHSNPGWDLLAADEARARGDPAAWVPCGE